MAVADTPPGTGWRVFAAAMIFIACVANVLWGIAGLTERAQLDGAQLLFGSLQLWGAVMLVVASLQFLTALLVLAQSRTGAVVGIAMAVVGVLTQLPAVGAYPLWSVLVIVVDGLVIYGLAVHDGRGRAAR